MNQSYRIGDQVIVYKTGTVIGASYDVITGKVKYTIMFEDGKNHFGSAIVTQDVITQTADQVLKQSEIDLLNERGIRA